MNEWDTKKTNEWDTKQIYMKNTCLFYVISQVLKVILIKSYMIELPVLLFLVVLHQQIDFLQVFRTSFFMLEKKLCHQFSFFNWFSQLLRNPFTHSHKSQNPLSVRKFFSFFLFFCLMLPNLGPPYIAVKKILLL